MNRWQTGVRAALGGLYKYSGAMALHERLARLVGQRFMTILLFHRVNDVCPTDDGLTVSTTHFRAIASLLARRFRVVPLGEVFRLLRDRLPVPPRTVAITFDDGYRDNLDAARVLHSLALPATFFLPTGFVGTERAFDWDRGRPPLAKLAWDDVRAMVAMGFEVGSHTVNHVNLGQVPAEEAREELRASKATLEDRLGVPVRWFAYPFGGMEDLRAEYLGMIQEVGYAGAVSAYGGFVWPGADDRVLPREAVPYFHSLLHLEMHLAGCLHPLYALTGRSARLARPPWQCPEAAYANLPPTYAEAPLGAASRGR
jgi:peptidoglycan/xylan/chitin deacetylase (PgdA/CDA1 family)